MQMYCLNHACKIYAFFSIFLGAMTSKSWDFDTGVVFLRHLAKLEKEAIDCGLIKFNVPEAATGQ